MGVGIMASSVLDAPTLGFKAGIGSAVSNVSGTTVVIALTAAVEIDDLVVVRCAADNLSATTPTMTCADSAGNTYTTHASLGVNATAAAGVVLGLFATKATAPIPIGGTITVTLSGAVVEKAAYAESFAGFKNLLARTLAVSTALNGNPGIKGFVGELVVGACAHESHVELTGDTDTVAGEWLSEARVPSRTDGADDASVSIYGQHKVPTYSTQQAYALSSAGSGDQVKLIAAFRPEIAPLFTEGFATLGAWTASGSSVAGGRNGNALQTSGTQFAALALATDQQLDTLTMGFAWRYTDALTTQRAIAALKSDADATTHLTLSYNPGTSTLSVFRGTTNLLGSVVVAIAQNEWRYIEWRAVLADSGGSAVVRVDGVEVLSVGPVDTKNAGTKTVLDFVRLWANLSSAVGQYDDLYLDVGATSTFHGDIGAVSP